MMLLHVGFTQYSIHITGERTDALVGWAASHFTGALFA